MKPALALIGAFCAGWAVSVLVACAIIAAEERRADRAASRLADEAEAWLKARSGRG